jgi:protein-L-isoaspartate(D-aspartate) O-methyltransferase
VIAPLVLLGCRSPADSLAHDTNTPPLLPASAFSSNTGDSDEARAYRAALIRGLADEIKSEPVLDAMRRVPRHLFVPRASLQQAYVDLPAPIGHGQTISQPTIVAIMTEALELHGRERVLEIGTGSGYQAAVLSLLASEVYTIEIVADLAEEARARLAQLGYSNVHVRTGDGYRGWPEQAPFERILVTAAPDVMPRALLDQLADEGVLVAPIGPSSRTQRLLRYRKRGGLVSSEDLGSVRFVPMVPGDAGVFAADGG